MKRLTSLILALCLLFVLVVPTSAEEDLQYNYSSSANSGKRHEICTTLNGTSADEYYTGSYTFDQLSEMDSDQLLSSLRTLMTSTHTYNSTYTDCKNKACKTDCENGDGKTVILFYTSYASSNAQRWDSLSTGWNREHVWPKSRGGFETTGPGSDLHHIRPSDAKVNSTRSNKLFGNVTSGSTAKGNITGSISGGKYNGTYFEPVDNVKGDAARIILYMYVRYGGSWSKCAKITNIFQSVDVLLEWCALDPVDTWEMGRNEVVEAIQGNRNVFIDYPELAWQLFGKEAPEDMITPSSGSSSADTSECKHKETYTEGFLAATCTEDGYTGNVRCSACQEEITAGTSIPATGHTYTAKTVDATCETAGTVTYTCHCGDSYTKTITATGHTEVIKNKKDATCCSKGYTGDTYCSVCDKKLATGKTIAATEEHTWGEWEVYKAPTATQPGYEMRYCTNSDCAEYQKKNIPATGSTEPTETEPEQTNGDRNEVNDSTKPTEGQNNGDRNEFTPGTTVPEETKPVETKPVETKPVETEPAETEPVTTAPTETVPETQTTAPSETVPATQDTVQPTTEPATTQPQTGEPTDPDDGDTSNHTWIILCGIILVACAVGIYLFFLPKTQKEDKYDPEAQNEEQ